MQETKSFLKRFVWSLLCPRQLIILFSVQKIRAAAGAASQLLTEHDLRQIHVEKVRCFFFRDADFSIILVMLVLWKGVFRQVFSLEKSSMPIREGCLSFRTRLLTTEKLPRVSGKDASCSHWGSSPEKSRHADLERTPLVSTEAPHQRKATVPIWQGGFFSPSKVLDHGFFSHHGSSPESSHHAHLERKPFFYNPESRQSS